MIKKITKIAVIGSGIMGSRIACHFANIGVQVLLLDITPKSLNEQEEARGFNLEDTIVRNRIVNNALKDTLKSKPSPIYSKVPSASDSIIIRPFSRVPSPLAMGMDTLIAVLSSFQ